MRLRYLAVERVEMGLGEEPCLWNFTDVKVELS